MYRNYKYYTKSFKSVNPVESHRFRMLIVVLVCFTDIAKTANYNVDGLYHEHYCKSVLALIKPLQEPQLPPQREPL